MLLPGKLARRVSKAGGGGGDEEEETWEVRADGDDLDGEDLDYLQLTYLPTDLPTG